MGRRHVSGPGMVGAVGGGGEEAGLWAGGIPVAAGAWGQPRALSFLSLSKGWFIEICELFAKPTVGGETSGPRR